MVFQGRRRLDNSSAYETSPYGSDERKTFKLSELQDLPPPQNQQTQEEFLAAYEKHQPKKCHDTLRDQTQEMRRPGKWTRIESMYCL